MKKNFKVIGYYADWNGDQLEKVDFSILTNLIYAFAIPTPEGNLRPLLHPGQARRLVETAHANHCSVSIALGGWSYLDIPLEATFAEATNAADKIESLSMQAVAMCEEYGFDGVDVDWEHPRIADGTFRQYEALILSLKEKLCAKGKLLTSAVLSGVTWDGKVCEDSKSQTERVLEAVDWLNVMTYDGGEGIRHSTYEFAVDCMNYWLKERGVKPEKIIMGLPFYSYIPPVSFEDIIKADPEAYGKDMVVIDGQEIHYNGVATIEKKTEFALQNCGGVMYWEVSEDTTKKEISLLQAIGKKVY